jgi:hypothetical protein
VGYGEWHSQSQFMFAGHAPWKNFPETFLLTYSAKKRAEVAPGVGAHTDMVVVGGLGQLTLVESAQMDYLESVDRIEQAAHQQATYAAQSTIAATFNELLQQVNAQAAEQQASAEPAAAPPQSEDADVGADTTPEVKAANASSEVPPDAPSEIE